jgi:hypothetical protein
MSGGNEFGFSFPVRPSIRGDHKLAWYKYLDRRFSRVYLGADNMPPTDQNNQDFIPSLPVDDWKETLSTLHMWTQIVGKIRMKLSPLVNHWWNVPLYVTPRGITTTAIPCPRGTLEIRFDFIDHQLFLESSTGRTVSVALRPRSVADFYQEVMRGLGQLGVTVKIWTTPCEVPDPIPFEKDNSHASYDAEAVQQFWRILVWVDQVFKDFRAGFLGKVSPVHFFWGSFDLAVTRFSGKIAPPREGADSITREAYSHEVSSAGFWPGGGNISAPAFYSYAAPEPEGFATYSVQPQKAFYHPEMKEFLLMYDDLSTGKSPREDVMEFLQTTYAAAADKGHWDRKALERNYRGQSA